MYPHRDEEIQVKFIKYTYSVELRIKEYRYFPAPFYLDSSVGRALHRHRSGHEFESRSSLFFFFLGLPFARSSVA